MTAGVPEKDIVKCRSCGADIVFLKTRNSKNMPVNVVPTDAKFRGPNAGELVFISGVHQSHFASCPNAADHRR